MTPPYFVRHKFYLLCVVAIYAQSRQSDKLFTPVVGIGTPPTPHPQACVPPIGSGGRSTLSGEKRGGRVPIPTKGHTLWYSVYVCTLCIYGPGTPFLLYTSV